MKLCLRRAATKTCARDMNWSGRIVFEKCKTRQFIEVFAFYPKIPFEAMYVDEVQQWTYLTNPDDSFPNMHPDSVHPALLPPAKRSR